MIERSGFYWNNDCGEVSLIDPSIPESRVGLAGHAVCIFSERSKSEARIVVCLMHSRHDWSILHFAGALFTQIGKRICLYAALASLVPLFLFSYAIPLLSRSSNFLRAIRLLLILFRQHIPHRPQ